MRPTFITQLELFWRTRIRDSMVEFISISFVLSWVTQVYLYTVKYPRKSNVPVIPRALHRKQWKQARNLETSKKTRPKFHQEIKIPTRNKGINKTTNWPMWNQNNPKTSEGFCLHLRVSHRNKVFHRDLQYGTRQLNVLKLQLVVIQLLTKGVAGSNPRGAHS